MIAHPKNPLTSLFFGQVCLSRQVCYPLPALTVLAVALWAKPLQGEIRYFELEITTPQATADSTPAQVNLAPALSDQVSAAENPIHENAKIRRVISSLDPLQYRSYHPLKPGENLRMIRSWRCSGRTGNRAPCNPPSP